MFEEEVRFLLERQGFKESTHEEFRNDYAQNDSVRDMQFLASEHNLNAYLPSNSMGCGNKKYYLVRPSENRLEVKAWCWKTRQRGV